MSTTLHQIVAVDKGVKAEANAAITGVYHLIQKGGLFEGIARSYSPVDDDGEHLPSESTKVQQRAEELLSTQVRAAWTRLLDLTATKDVANTEAKADIVVDGTTIATDMPVSYLIWLEKQLLDLRSVISKLPTLDNAFTWTPGPSGDWATPVVQTVKTKKIPRNHVLAEATVQHPAQVTVWHEDVKVGTWDTIKFSGAMPAARQRELLARVDALAVATKFAREEANVYQVTDQHVGAALFAYLLA